MLLEQSNFAAAGLLLILQSTLGFLTRTVHFAEHCVTPCIILTIELGQKLYEQVKLYLHFSFKCFNVSAEIYMSLKAKVWYVLLVIQDASSDFCWKAIRLVSRDLLLKTSDMLIFMFRLLILGLEVLSNFGGKEIIYT